MRTFYSTRTLKLRLSTSCLLLLSAKASQDGTSLAAELRRAIFLHWDTATQTDDPPRRSRSLRDSLTCQMGRGLWDRMKLYRGSNRSAVVERCAWLYLERTAVSRETKGPGQHCPSPLAPVVRGVGR